MRMTGIMPKFRIIKDIFKKGVPATMHTDYSHLKVGLVKINTVWPCPEEHLREATKDAGIIIVPEMNIGKYSREIERVLKDKKVIPMSKCGGDIHTPSEILDEILKEV